ncbi:hypothetical protein RD792_006651 [Penstemon davidsonii]|uniref:Uncharacterized protein n=1 Tax=Penstemon davidsonii TaxID=160366 RepID=A0ABR0DBX7_9LAMI|nr:hypothetical protein RD792_006651 [Penstemon davidsonii]
MQSTSRKYRLLTLQDNHGTVSPTKIDVVLFDDLVDCARRGKYVEVIGIYSNYGELFPKYNNVPLGKRRLMEAHYIKKACVDKLSKDPNAEKQWSSSRSSWYGNPYGAGSEGGACGYQYAVDVPPFSKLITAAANTFYQSGKGCGTCYQVKCTSSSYCSGYPVTVVITDQCPECDSRSIAFDLSGSSFGALARPGQANQLRSVGIVQIQYRRVDCNFRGVSVAFRVDPGSNNYYFSTVIEYENGDGLAKVELNQNGQWLQMQQLWGANWKINAPGGLRPPFSIRLTSANTWKTIVARNVIPANYKPGQTYRSFVNF